MSNTAQKLFCFHPSQQHWFVPLSWLQLRNCKANQFSKFVWESRSHRLGWLPSQAKLPLYDGWRRTWQMCHWSWNVKSTIIKAELPQHKPGSPWESWSLPTTSQLHLSALHDLYSGPFSILLAGGCPQVVILAQLPFAVEMLAQIWAK